MSERKVIHVTPHGSAWDVKGEGSNRVTGHFENKEEAVSRAREIAQSAPLGQVIIHKRDGTIETEHTYGEDPRSKPG